jgi:hypothetical protein
MPPDKMAIRLSFIVALCLNSLFAAAMVSKGRRGHGLIGYGITLYDPTCAFACRDTISSSFLNCSSEELAMDDMDMSGSSTDPECYATDDAFLGSLAWCISTHCQESHLHILLQEGALFGSFFMALKVEIECFFRHIHSSAIDCSNPTRVRSRDITFPSRRGGLAHMMDVRSKKYLAL